MEEATIPEKKSPDPVKGPCMKKIWMIVILAGGFGTCFLTYLAWNAAYDRAKRIFDFEAGRIREAVFERIQASDAVAKSMQAFFQASLMMDGDQFQIFAGKIVHRYPFIHSVTYYPRVNREDVRRFEEEQHLFGSVGVRVHEHDERGDPRALTDRPVYWPALYHYPVDAGIIGYDAFSDPEMAPTITRAIDGAMAYPSFVTTSGGKIRYRVFIALYEGKHLPESPSARRAWANGLISLAILPDSLFRGITIPDAFGVRLDNQSVADPPERRSSLVFRKSPDTVRFRLLHLEADYPLVIATQKFHLAISKCIPLLEFDIWLVFFAVGVGLAGSGAAFVILRGRAALRRELQIRHHAEVMLQRLNKDLELRVRDRTLELERANAKLSGAMKALWGEMELARKLQTSLLPRSVGGLHPEFDIAAVMRTADEVGGDFYDARIDGSGALRLVIGDVSGHGITPGLIMMMAQTAHAAVTACLDCDARTVVTRINEILYANVHNRLGENHFMTITALKYLGNGIFEHAGPHLRIILHRRKTGQCDLVPTTGVYLNFRKDISKSTKNAYLELAPGDIMVLYTDGLTEAENPDGELFDIHGLVDAVRRHAAREPETMRDAIMDDVLAWCGGGREDDMTLLIVRRKEMAG